MENKKVFFGILGIVLLILFLYSFASSVNAAETTYTYLKQWDGSNGSSGKFSKPSGVAIFNSTLMNFIYIADNGNNRVQRFDLNGNQAPFPSGGNSFSYHSPSGIAIDSLGFVYVSDGTGLYVRKLDSVGSVKQSWRTDLLNSPAHVAVDPSGSPVYVVNLWDNKIYKFFGGIFSLFSFIPDLKPSGIATDSTKVYVTYCNQNKIIIFNKDGTQIGQYNVPTIGPTAIAVDSYGYVYVMSVTQKRILKYILTSDKQLKNINTFGADGNLGADVFGIAIDKSSGNVYVTDYDQNCIKVFKRSFISFTPIQFIPIPK